MRKEGADRVRNKGKKTLYISILIMVFLVGTCFDEIKTHSVLLYNPCKSTTVEMVYADTVIWEPQLVSNELYCTHRSMGLEQSVSRMTSHNKEQNSSFSLVLDILSLKDTASYSKCEEVYFVSESHRELVVDFMHRSDGKKRI